MDPQIGRRVAIVHEWLDAYAGAEQVFEALAGVFPEADLVALSREPGLVLDTGGRPVKTTVLDHPGLRKRRSLILPLMPLAWRALGRGDYDLVISSHHAFAHCNRFVRAGGRHLCYVHSPARYVWSPEIDRRGAAWYLAPARSALRRADLAASGRVDTYAANSTAVAQRIEHFWNRAARVIHPPVRVEFFSEPAPTAPTRDYVLGVGRWVAYKNLHHVIEAGDRAGLPVKIAGRGPDRSRILAAASAAKVPVELIESPSDERLRELYRNAACLMFPTVEDFGIVPIEAQAAGTPVVALSQGGAIDTIADGISGILVPSADPDCYVEGILKALSLDGQRARANAAQFAASKFASEIIKWVEHETAHAQ